MIAVDSQARTITIDGRRHSCLIGRAGAIDADAKREGDGCTPLGHWPLRSAIVRPDKGFTPPKQLPWRWCRPSDGWCDDPRSYDYNRPILFPYEHSAERLWRDDGAYDVVLLLGHNDAPPLPGRGSAIFLHLEIGNATEGCVAVDGNAMREIMDYAGVGTVIVIS